MEQGWSVNTFEVEDICSIRGSFVHQATMKDFSPTQHFHSQQHTADLTSQCLEIFNTKQLLKNVCRMKKQVKQ